jgi:hypothetical protein
MLMVPHPDACHLQKGRQPVIRVAGLLLIRARAEQGLQVCQAAKAEVKRLLCGAVVDQDKGLADILPKKDLSEVQLQRHKQAYEGVLWPRSHGHCFNPCLSLSGTDDEGQ